MVVIAKGPITNASNHKVNVLKAIGILNIENTKITGSPLFP